VTFRRTTCPQCRKKFTAEEKAARRLIHPECIEAYAEAEEARSERKKAKELRAQLRVERAADRKKRESLKPRAKWLAEAQAVCNKYVRVRDTIRGCGCISCGARPDAKFGGAMDAGHWRSVGSAPHLRFYLPQIALQCVKCNRFFGGNAVEMRKGLVERLGVERVEEIAAMQHVAKFDIEYLKRLKSVIGKRLRRMESRHGM